jgi:hypothetical protein
MKIVVLNIVEAIFYISQLTPLFNEECIFEVGLDKC